MNKVIVSIYIKEHFGDKFNGASKKMQKDQPRVFDALYEYTDYLPKSASFTERCYNVMNNLSERPLCENEGCDNLVKFKSFKSGYNKTCSKTCKG